MGDLPDKKKWLISFSLVYNSGLYINVSQPTEFSKLIYTVLSYVYETCLLATFDVQNGSLEVTNSTTGEISFTCYYVTGSQAQGCFVKYECFKMDFNGNITIERNLSETTATKCVNGIYTCNYNVTFYDIDHNNTIYEDDYAVKLTNQYVTGLSPTSATLTLTLTTTVDTPISTSLSGVLSSTSVISSSPSPTTTSEDNTSKLLLIL